MNAVPDRATSTVQAPGGFRSSVARAPWWAWLALVTAVFALVGWQLLMQVGPRAGYDSPALEAYAELFDAEGRLPRAAENYEYWLPPGLPVAAVMVKRATEALPLPPGPVSALPEPVRQVAWLALVAAGLLLLATPGRRRWGVVGTVVAVVWAALHVLWCVKTIPWPSVSGASWLGYPVLSLAACTGLVAGTGLVAREVFPRARFAPALVALAAVLLPIVPRIAVFFHPDPWLAFFTATALWLVLRAARTGWSPWLGLASGLVMGLGALVRPSAALVIACLGLGALVVGRRRAVSFLVVGALGVLALAGPWWVAQTIRTGNPLQSNLNRPGYMLDHQPRSFYVSFPVRDLLLHPYRPRFENELLPRFHAELWADWGGNLFDRAAPTTVDRVTASSQSILGFGGDALVLGGFLALGIPALRRARHGALRPADSGLATATILFTIGWIAYVATLIRYPQAEGDPIKSNYVLFLAPACAIAAYAAARSLWRRGGLGRVLLCAWLALYLVSFGVMLAGAG